MIVLTLLALLPPLFMMVQIYRKDEVEKEPISLIIKTVIFGALCSIPTIIAEVLLGSIIGAFVPEKTILFMLLENFIGVALVEEFFKMQACKLSIWKNKEFNYTFDGVVYCVASAVGFAGLENLLYVYDSGISTAILRAVTSIPGHTIFGIFMGIYIGLSKYEKVHGDEKRAKRYARMALLIPTVIHGTYDFLCSLESTYSAIAFIIGLIILDIVAVRRLNQSQRQDRNIFE